MWKCVTRRIRDTFERSANHFDRRSTTVVNNGPANFSEDKKNCAPCNWFSFRGCCGSYQNNDNGTKNKKWNFEHLNNTWMGAITWSGALVLGWYTSQLIHIKLKQHLRGHQNINQNLSINNLLSSIHPYINNVNSQDLYVKSVSKIGQAVSNLTPTVYLMSNEHNASDKHKSSTSSEASGSNSSNFSSDNDLGEVLNSIENRLGLASIENGQYQEGLNLLRSAANRNHAPAMYNLGLCYEMGLGVSANEKMAMELYKSAAALNHPGALYNLGVYYGQGRGGLKTDQETATRLLRLAAIQGQQDAIDALKSLDVNISEPRNSIDTWEYQRPPKLPSDNISPMISGLFVENLNFWQAKEVDAI